MITPSQYFCPVNNKTQMLWILVYSFKIAMNKLQQLTFPPHRDIFPIKRCIFFRWGYHYLFVIKTGLLHLQGHKCSPQFRGNRTTRNVRWAHILQKGAETEVHLRGARHHHSALPKLRILLLRVKIQSWTLKRSQTASLSPTYFLMAVEWAK